MRPVWQRIPWPELVVELLAILALPPLIGVLAAIADFDAIYVALVVLGTIALVIITVAHYEWWRGKLRRRTPTPREAIRAADGWLGDNGYTRGQVALDGYTHAIKVTGLTCSLWIAVPEGKNILQFLTARIDSGDTIGKLPLDEQTKLMADIGAEIVRMGAFYQSATSPYEVTITYSLPLDEGLSEAKILERTLFIERVDYLVHLLYGKMLATSLTAPSAPPQPTPGTEGPPP